VSAYVIKDHYVSILVENAWATELMDVAGPMRTICMLRRDDAVARSNIRRFGMEYPFRDPLCRRPASLAVPRRHRRDLQAASLLRRGLPPPCRRTLLVVRNRLYFDQQLWQDHRIRVLR